MSEQERLPKLPQELLNLQRSLSTFKATSTLSRDEVIFAAGKAAGEQLAASRSHILSSDSVPAKDVVSCDIPAQPSNPLPSITPQRTHYESPRHNTVSHWWRLAAACFAGLSAMLAIGLVQKNADVQTPAIVANNEAIQDVEPTASQSDPKQPTTSPDESASAHEPSIAGGSLLPNRQRTRTATEQNEAALLHRLMASVDQFTTRRAMAISMNRRIQPRRTAPFQSPRHQTPPTSRTATTKEILKEFLP